MRLRFFHIFSLFVVAALVIVGCKGSSTDSNNTTTHINIGDSIPKTNSNYSFSKSQLDASDNIIPSTTLTLGIFAIVDSTGMSILGKKNVYFVFDDGDTAYYSYEGNSDVSIYFQNPGFLSNYRDGQQIDITLQAVENVVFHNWITLPIASKGTITLADQTPIFNINGAQVKSSIHTVIENIGDSSIIVSKDTLTAKHCRISITAQLAFANDHEVLTHVRNIWFVPKIGYIAKLTTRTYMPAISFYVVPLDTTATLKALTSYQLK